jgi:hypothetical protein
MTATPALTPDIFGRYQKKISDAFYLDHKESEYILRELHAFAAELLNQYHQGYYSDADPGDEHA